MMQLLLPQPKTISAFQRFLKVVDWMESQKVSLLLQLVIGHFFFGKDKTSIQASGNTSLESWPKVKLTMIKCQGKATKFLNEIVLNIEGG